MIYLHRSIYCIYDNQICDTWKEDDKNLIVDQGDILQQNIWLIIIDNCYFYEKDLIPNARRNKII